MQLGQWIYNPEVGIDSISPGKIYALSIYSCPGNKFKLDGNEIIINNYGNFTIDFGNDSIETIAVVEANINTIPTIIDYYYE